MSCNGIHCAHTWLWVCVAETVWGERDANPTNGRPQPTRAVTLSGSARDIMFKSSEQPPDGSPAAFLFNYAHPSVGRSYAHLAGQAMEAVGGQSLVKAAVVRMGDMQTHTFTQRLMRVQKHRLDPLRPQLVRHSSTTLRDDSDARFVICLHIYGYFLGEGLLASPQHSWDAVDANTVFVTSLDPIDTLPVHAAHDILTNVPSYLGYVPVDPGCPIIRNLLWDGLSVRYVVGPGATVKLVPTAGATDEDEWTRPEADMINDFELTNRGWLEANEEAIWQLGNLPPSPLSDFGKRSQQLLQKAMRPRRRELLASVLQELIGTDVLPQGFDFVVGEVSEDHLHVPEEKLTKYLLDANHPVGRNKARWFYETLAIGPDDWQFLLDQLREGVPLSPPETVRVHEHGVSYSVIMEVTGRNSRVAAIRTAWIAHAEGPPRFVTAYPADS